MKMPYECPEMEISKFEVEDVITLSVGAIDQDALDWGDITWN